MGPDICAINRVIMNDTARPKGMPITVPTIPSAAASENNNRVTCLRVAPSDRRMANARLRSLMLIRNELRMTNAPATKDAMLSVASNFSVLPRDSRAKA